ncbi:MAG: redoxin domain-containing protein [Chloroflexi bacterium]|nr:redoxin domain-containing protein [Chloroflexota bacterium]
MSDSPTGAAAGDLASTASRKALKQERRRAQDVARQRYEAAQHRRRLLLWGAGILVAVLALGGLAYWLSQPTGPGGLPGPLGGPSVAQDVDTQVGQPAPAFTLPDSEGQPHTVAPGQGKPVVLVFHMGIT